MGVNINLKDFFASDSQEILVEKLVYNFNQLLTLGVGTRGYRGYVGYIGPIGPLGVRGYQGIRGNYIYTGDNSEFPTSGLMDRDQYVNTEDYAIYNYDDSTSPGTWDKSIDFEQLVISAVASSPALAPTFVRLNLEDATDLRFIAFKDSISSPQPPQADRDTLFLHNFDFAPFDDSMSTSRNTNLIQSGLLSIFKDRTALNRYNIVIGAYANGSPEEITTHADCLKISHDFNTVTTSMFDLSTEFMGDPYKGMTRHTGFRFRTSDYTTLSINRNRLNFYFGTKEFVSEYESSYATSSDGLTIGRKDNYGEYVHIGLEKNAAIIDAVIGTGSTINNLRIQGGIHPYNTTVGSLGSNSALWNSLYLDGLSVDKTAADTVTYTALGTVKNHVMETLNGYVSMGSSAVGDYHDLIHHAKAPTTTNFALRIRNIGNTPNEHVALELISYFRKGDKGVTPTYNTIEARAKTGIPPQYGPLIFMSKNLTTGYNETWFHTSGMIIGNNTWASPASMVGVHGNMAIGTGYSTTAAPTDGLIVEGRVGISWPNPPEKLSINGNITFKDGADRKIYVNGTHGDHLFIRAGHTVLSGNSGGNLYLDSGKDYSNVIVGTRLTRGLVILGTDVTATNNGLVIGGGSIDPNSMLEIFGNITLNYGANRSIGMAGKNSSHTTDLTIHGGDISLGFMPIGNGGDLYVRGGYAGVTGIGGDLYLDGGNGIPDGNVYIGKNDGNVVVGNVMAPVAGIKFHVKGNTLLEGSTKIGYYGMKVKRMVTGRVELTPPSSASISRGTGFSIDSIAGGSSNGYGKWVYVRLDFTTAFDKIPVIVASIDSTDATHGAWTAWSYYSGAGYMLIGATKNNNDGTAANDWTSGTICVSFIAYDVDD